MRHYTGKHGCSYIRFFCKDLGMGTVYKLADQKMVVEHAGHKVTITGKLEGETITVEKVTM